MPTTYDKQSNRYRSSDGRFISHKAIGAEIDKHIEQGKREIRDLSKKLVDGKINLSEWTLKMRDSIKSNHIIAASVAKGGHEQMTPKDWGKLGSELKKQYSYLQSFSRDIANGKVNPNAIVSRAASYLQSARTTFFAIEQETQESEGLVTKARRVLHAIESCPECLAWARRGYVAIEKLPPIGSLICRSYCRCSLEYQTV